MTSAVLVVTGAAMGVASLSAVRRLWACSAAAEQEGSHEEDARRRGSRRGCAGSGGSLGGSGGGRGAVAAPVGEGGGDGLGDALLVGGVGDGVGSESGLASGAISMATAGQVRLSSGRREARLRMTGSLALWRARPSSLARLRLWGMEAAWAVSQGRCGLGFSVSAARAEVKRWMPEPLAVAWRRGRRWGGRGWRSGALVGGEGGRWGRRRGWR